jgi:hypothetical protein
MLDNSLRISPEQVAYLKWTGSAVQYDTALYQLGNGQDIFWALNPEFDDYSILTTFIKKIPKTKRCVIFEYQGTWLVKLFRNGWKPSSGYEVIEVNLNLNWIRNPEIDEHILFDQDPKTSYIDPWDLEYELIWTIDTEWYPGKNPQWLYRLTVDGKEPKGEKFMGNLVPKFDMTINPVLPDLKFTIDYHIPWYDMTYEHIWMLDPKHTVNAAEPIWAVKVSASSRPSGTKIIDNIEPDGELEINGDVPVPFKLPKDFVVQYYNFSYEHVWVSRENNEKIWLARLTYVDNPAGTTEYEITDELNPDTLDVVFISYGEPNAEENWVRVKEKAPWAQRVDGVKGILEAHRTAAQKARTDMFYVVDGDAFLFKKFEFKYKPSIFDRDCTYIWSAKNPLADLTYGHGGVKLFSRSKLLKLKKWRTLDMTTSVSEKIKVMSEISNWTAFNTDDFGVWKTAFRECVKLAFNVYRYPDNPEHGLRLDKWKEIDQTKPFGKIAVQASKQAIEFVKSNSFDMVTLININNRDWLETLYNNTYKKVKNDRQRQSA